MFEIKIDNAKYWKSCVDSIVNLVDEGSFLIAKEGISLKAMDPSGIGMVSFFMPNKAFSKYDVDAQANIGLNLENFSKILSSARFEEQLVMKESGKKLALEFVGKSSKRRYSLPLIDVKKDIDKEPKIDFTASVELRSDAFKEILKDVDMLSSYINFRLEKDSFSVAAKGDAGDLEEEHSASDYIKKLDVKSPANATFNLDYLSRMVSAATANSSIKLWLKNSDDPTKIEYEIGDAKVAYYLAPYMES
ncbi:MAG: proliferating cell nuclear antigen (pcna) [Candidatus Micrarchaeia archaeon]